MTQDIDNSTKNKRDFSRLRKLRLFLCLIIVFTLLAVYAKPAVAQSSPTPTPTPVVDRLGEPAMPENPTQADQGHFVYYQVCMACHGDRGQGLTDEWRLAWGDDFNCWESKCHGPNHPPQGFEFPQITSPVIGAGTLIRFDNALELNQYLVETMPWWNPGYLKEDEYWQLTAYLLREHHALPKGVTLDAGNAIVFPLRPSSPSTDDHRGEVLLVGGILVMAAVIVALQNHLRR